METVQSYLTYHSFEGGALSAEYARELLVDAIGCGFLVDAQDINQINVDLEVKAANESAARMMHRMGVQP